MGILGAAAMTGMLGGGGMAAMMQPPPQYAGGLPGGGAPGRKEVFCAKCAKKYPATSSFCPFCGNKYSPCPRCGNDNLPGARRCVSCGVELAQGPAAGGGFDSACSRCGQEVKPGTKFCPHCGNKIE
jgi:predicted amidophosphoribosyltransferase